MVILLQWVDFFIFTQFCFLPMFLGLFTTANYNLFYKKNIKDSVCVVAKAKKTSNEFKILLTAKKDFIKNDSNSIEINTRIPMSIRTKKI